MTGSAVETTRLSSEAMNSAMPVITMAQTARPLAVPPVPRLPSAPPGSCPTGTRVAPGAVLTDRPVVGSSCRSGSATVAPSDIPWRRPRRARRRPDRAWATVRHLLRAADPGRKLVCD